MLTIEWNQHGWTLLPEKALHWPSRRAAIVADVHFGKAAAFRARGVPVPEAATSRDLARLTAIIAATRCEQLLILGDLLHARDGRADATMRAIELWRDLHPSLRITLVRGNHDLHAGDPPPAWRIECVDEPFEFHGVLLRHAPDDGAVDETDARPSIAGHVHPCVRLRDADGSSLRTPAFIVSPRSILMPAFGSFTGGHVVRPLAGDRVFAVGDGQVMEIAAANLPAGAP